MIPVQPYIRQFQAIAVGLLRSLNLIMLSFLFNFLILSLIFRPSHEQHPVKTRDFFSTRLKSTIMNSKLKQIELLNPKGITKMLPRIVEECNITLWNGKRVETGYMFRSNDLLYPPKVSWSYQEGHYYTLFLGDIDHQKEHNPNIQLQASCKWLVSNIPGCEIEKGKPIFAYSRPKKTPADEVRRYLVLIYDQRFDEPIKFSEGGYFEVDQMGDFLHMDSSKERRDFCVHKFTDWYHFGPPIAANLYMIAEEIIKKV